MKGILVVVAAMFLAVVATGAFAQGGALNVQQGGALNVSQGVYAFIGTVNDINGNQVTIDIDQVQQSSRGNVSFPQNQWTFTFGTGAKIYKNDSPAGLRDFSAGDRVVIEAQKRSGSNTYVPIRMDGVFVFIGAINDINGNQVTINIDQPPQTGNGKIDFSWKGLKKLLLHGGNPAGEQRTFRLGAGAKILRNDSPANLSDFGPGDRVVVEARKLPGRDYEPIQMMDEQTANLMLDRFTNRQSYGTNVPQTYVTNVPKGAYIFLGTINDISGNQVTIDIDQVQQSGKGNIDFSQSQWTFNFGTGANFFQNGSPASLRDFSTGDRVVIETQKRSGSNTFVPTRMSDEQTAHIMLDRMNNPQSYGRNVPQGVFVFIGTISDINGNQVTIDIDQVQQSGKGNVNFSQNQWTFNFGTGSAQIFQNGSPASLSDFGTGDRVAIEAQKRSARNYEPTRMSDEASARLVMGQQSYGQNAPKGVYIFFGTISDINGNQVTIDIDEVQRSGTGTIDFPQNQWTFTFGTGAKFFQNGSRASLGDFSTGDQVVIQARKRSAKNYVPIQMSE